MGYLKIFLVLKIPVEQCYELIYFSTILMFFLIKHPQSLMD